MISFVDRTSLSSALADKGFVHEFALSSVERGWLNSAFFWSYGLLQMPMGWLVDRYGVKWPYTSASCCGARRRRHRHGDDAVGPDPDAPADRRRRIGGGAGHLPLPGEQLRRNPKGTALGHLLDRRQDGARARRADRRLADRAIRIPGS
jgi:hypothetical protein